MPNAVKQNWLQPCQSHPIHYITPLSVRDSFTYGSVREI